LAAGAIVSDYAGAPLALSSGGAMAAVPSLHGELVELCSGLLSASDG
jgi:hypothetical protein